MSPDRKFQRAVGVFLARLLIVYGTDAPEQLRRVANELEALEQDIAEDTDSQPVVPRH